MKRKLSKIWLFIMQKWLIIPIIVALIVGAALWTVIVVPFLGFWFPMLLAQLRLYVDLNRDLNIEAQFIAVEGDPWAKDSFEEFSGEEPPEPDPMNSSTRHREALLKDIDRNKEGK